MTNTIDKNLHILNRRVERLNKEIETKAPAIIVNHELDLIISATNDLRPLVGVAR